MHETFSIFNDFQYSFRPIRWLKAEVRLRGNEAASFSLSDFVESILKERIQSDVKKIATIGDFFIIMNVQKEI